MNTKYIVTIAFAVILSACAGQPEEQEVKVDPASLCPLVDKPVPVIQVSNNGRLKLTKECRPKDGSPPGSPDVPHYKAEITANPEAFANGNTETEECHMRHFKHFHAAGMVKRIDNYIRKIGDIDYSETIFLVIGEGPNRVEFSCFYQGITQEQEKDFERSLYSEDDQPQTLWEYWFPTEEAAQATEEAISNDELDEVAAKSATNEVPYIEPTEVESSMGDEFNK